MSLLSVCFVFLSGVTLVLSCWTFWGEFKRNSHRYGLRAIAYGFWSVIFFLRIYDSLMPTESIGLAWLCAILSLISIVANLIRLGQALNQEEMEKKKKEEEKEPEEMLEEREE